VDLSCISGAQNGGNVAGNKQVIKPQVMKNITNNFLMCRCQPYRTVHLSVQTEKDLASTCFIRMQNKAIMTTNQLERDNYMKNGVFWDVTPCGSCKNRRFGGTWRLLHQGDKNR
jgi:hypothetical protein